MNRRTFLSSSLAAVPLLSCRAPGKPCHPGCEESTPSRASPSPSSSPSPSPSSSRAPSPRPALELIEAPSNLGLRPPREGHEPGAWQAPQVLGEAGLGRALPFTRHVKLARPAYSFAAQPGTGVRNGQSLRTFNLELAALVEESLRRGARPVVVGGDCSNLLGCLVGLRRAGGRGVVHVDGHSDFVHPGNYDRKGALGSAAGMDLALATGRGEALLTAWPGVEGPLVADEDAVQIGERETEDPLFYKDLAATKMERLTVQWALEHGLPAATARAIAHLEQRHIERAWMHVDLDVLDEQILPAVDSPGHPGLDWAQLGQLVRDLLGTGRVAGLDVAIYDPELDPPRGTERTYAPRIVEMLASALA